MQNQSRWPAPAPPRPDGGQARVGRQDRFLVLARRISGQMVAFYRELDRGRAVMYGQGPPTQPRPAELDTLARTHLLRPPYEDW